MKTKKLPQPLLANQQDPRYLRGPRFLFDGAHIAANRANALIEPPDIQKATCPIVENGVIRVLNLLGLAVKQNIPIRAVRGAKVEHLLLL